jgi:hypothetical protein
MQQMFFSKYYLSEAVVARDSAAMAAAVVQVRCS